MLVEVMTDSFRNLVSQKRQAILDKWRSSILDSYPAEGSLYIRTEKDRFENPNGYAITAGTELLFNRLTGEMDQRETHDALESILRIRAVQGFTASEAISFIPRLKQIVRQELTGAPGDSDYMREMEIFDSRVDGLVLMALDVYSGCRQQMYEIRIEELRKEKENLLRLLERTVPTLDGPRED